MSTQKITIVTFFLLFFTNTLHASQSPEKRRENTYSTGKRLEPTKNPTLEKEVSTYITLITEKGISNDLAYSNMKEGIMGLESIGHTKLKDIEHPNVRLDKLLDALGHEKAVTAKPEYIYNIARQAHRFALELFLANYEGNENKNLRKTNKKELEEKVTKALKTINEDERPYVVALRYELICIQAIINSLKDGKTVKQKITKNIIYSLSVLSTCLQLLIDARSSSEVFGGIEKIPMTVIKEGYGLAVKAFRVAWYAKIVHIKNLSFSNLTTKAYHQALLNIVKAPSKKSDYMPFNLSGSKWQVQYTFLEVLTEAICADNVAKPRGTTISLFEGLKSYATFNKFSFVNNWRIQGKVGQSMIDLATYHKSPYIQKEAKNIIKDFYTRKQKTNFRVLALLNKTRERIKLYERLCTAYNNGYTNEVKKLLNNNLFEDYIFLLNQVDKEGNTFLARLYTKIKLEDYNLLLIAAQHGQIDMLDYLINVHKMNPNSKDNQGKNALLIAKRYGETKMVDHLIKVHKMKR